MGRSRPSLCRNCWSCSGETVPLSPSPPPRIVKAGSPGTIQNRANTMIVANSSVGRKSSARRMAYLPIQRSHLRLVAREWGVGVHQICSNCLTICSEPGTWKFWRR